MTLDLTKPVKTRSGLPVRILCTDRPGPRPVVALVGVDGHIVSYLPCGSFSSIKQNHQDLVNVLAFDPTKPVRTRDGRSARIVCTDRVVTSGNPYTIGALVMDHNGDEEYFVTYTPDGLKFSGEKGGGDLINI